jgi:hypothetical protein
MKTAFIIQYRNGTLPLVITLHNVIISSKEAQRIVMGQCLTPELLETVMIRIQIQAFQSPPPEYHHYIQIFDGTEQSTFEI